MKIVIELSDETYKDIKEENSIYGTNNGLSTRITGKVVGAIQNGIPLPKGHGRIGDLDELEKRINNYIKQHAHMMDEFTVLNAKFILEGIKDTPTIIEADKEN